MTSFSLLSVMLVVAAIASSTKADPPGPKVLQFKVPLHVEAGTDVTLECIFDMGGYELYTVKYYFNGDEFYRYTPKDEEVKQYFKTPVVVNLDKSDQNRVMLPNVSLAFSGVYECEVSSENPDFLSDNLETNMTVTVIPNEKPTIEGFTGHYALGHKIDLNCTGAPSIPPASLAWYINDKEAPEEFLVRYNVSTTEGLKEARLGLKFTIHDKHYVDRVLKLRCTATIATLYTKSDEHSHQQHNQDPNKEPPRERELRGKAANAGSSLIMSTIIASFGLCTILLLL